MAGDSFTSKIPTMAAGWRYERLVAIEFSERDAHRKQRWRFRCDCGAEFIANVSDVKARKTQSCGCLNNEKIAEIGRAKRTHGQTKTPEYRIWTNMIVRCTNPQDENYHNYGGRGIRMCDAWADSFEAFYRDMGPRPSPQHSVDRIDNDGNYEPGNVQWSTASQQGRNRRTTHFVTVDGISMSLIEAAERSGTPYKVVLSRVHSGWDAGRALSAPVAKRARRQGSAPA